MLQNCTWSFLVNWTCQLIIDWSLSVFPKASNCGPINYSPMSLPIVSNLIYFHAFWFSFYQYIVMSCDRFRVIIFWLEAVICCKSGVSGNSSWKVGMQCFNPIPVLESWENSFPFLFSIPNVRNAKMQLQNSAFWQTTGLVALSSLVRWWFVSHR